MSQSKKNPDPRPAQGGSFFELRLSSAVVCGLSAVVLQVAALEQAPLCAALVEEAQASSSPDPMGGLPTPSVASRRGQALPGNGPSSGGPPAVGNPLHDSLAVAEPAARESAFVAAALAASKRLAGHPLRGPPRLPS